MAFTVGEEEKTGTHPQASSVSLELEFTYQRRKMKNVLAFCHFLTIIICSKSPGNLNSLMLR